MDDLFYDQPKCGQTLVDVGAFLNANNIFIMPEEMENITFSLCPSAPVESALSLPASNGIYGMGMGVKIPPARSTSEILLT
jgi:hypothetical protein